MATVRDNPAEHRNEIHEGTVLAGFVTYERRDRTMTFVHTETTSRPMGSRLNIV